VSSNISSRVLWYCDHRHESGRPPKIVARAAPDIDEVSADPEVSEDESSMEELSVSPENETVLSHPPTQSSR